MGEALLGLNRLFLRSYPDDVGCLINDERAYVQNIPNWFIMRWFDYNGFYNGTQYRSCRNVNNFKKMYKLCCSEYISDKFPAIVIEMKSRKCKRTDKFARQNYVFDDWHQYGYILWRLTADGESYIREYETHHEVNMVRYLLKCDLKHYA